MLPRWLRLRYGPGQRVRQSIDRLASQAGSLQVGGDHFGPFLSGREDIHRTLASLGGQGGPIVEHPTLQAHSYGGQCFDDGGNLP